jgi:hypothetical protein
MNRAQRRAAASQHRPDTRARVEHYRAPPGHVALTFDLAGRPPSTLSISAASLTHVIDHIAELVADKTYAEVLHILAAAIQAADAGCDEAWNVALVGFWLATHHPVGGAEMAARLSDAIAVNGYAHISLHVGPDGRGLAFGLAPAFVNLDDIAAAARKVGVGAFVLSEPRRQRPGGRA